MSLAAAIDEALKIPAPHASQQQVQETVARRLTSLSPKTSIKRTGYFNHSWAPDLVAVDSDDDVERLIYLRFDVKDASFESDLHYLAEKQPFFLDLAADPPQREEEDSLDLDDALKRQGRSEVMVSEVAAIDRFEDSVAKDRDVKVATRQVVLGGKGLVNQQAAETIVSSWNRASEAVASADRSVLREALDGVETFLSRIASLDLETDLRARWIASGQAAETFPSREEWRLGDRSPREIAQLVAALTDDTDDASDVQWGDIAQAISASSLGHELSYLGVNRDGGRVNELVRAGLPHWTARYAYVPPLDSDSMVGSFDWSFGKYAFGLNLIRRQAYFTDLGRKWTRVARAESLPDARGRLPALSNPAVLGAGIVTPEENVSHELRPNATASLGDRLEPFIGEGTDASWRSARLTWLELKVPGSGATVHVNFERSVVRATDSIPLRTFALLVAEFVAGLDESELALLKATLE